ncbi:hypothetical protein HRH25_21750 [Flavisolibacter sp. BT320]|nr:hypothetical protein [Flavisolibacter longurius]
MKFFVLGNRLELEESKETPLLWQTKPVGTVMLQANSLRINITEDVNFSGANAVFSVMVKSGAQIRINVASRTGSYTGSLAVTLYKVAITGIVPVLSDRNEVNFAIAVNDLLNKLVYEGTIGNNFERYATIHLNGVIDRIGVKAITINLADSCIDLFIRPDQHYSIRDSIQIKAGPTGGASGESIGFDQKMLFDRIRISLSGGCFIFVVPEKNYLPVFPDVINMSQEMTTNKKELQIKYQFALANGMVCLQKEPDEDGMAFWVRHLIHQEDPLLIMPNISDSNSYPTVVKTSVNRFELTFRNGLQSLIDPTPANRFEKTIQGLSLADVMNATLHELSYDTIDWDRKEKQLFGVNLTAQNSAESLDSPFWLPPDGIVKVQTSTPDTLHSLTKGAWLESKNRFSTTPLKCALRSEPVQLGTEDIYHVMTLELDPAQWDLYSQYEERESRAVTIDTTPIFHIDSRKFVAQNAEPLVLPATDYLLGAANIVDPSGKKTTAVPTAIQNKIAAINKTLANFSAEAVGQEHVQGFLRSYKDDSQKVIVDTVFLYPPPKARTIAETLPAPIQVRPGVVDFKHGNYKHQKNSLAVAPKTDVLRMDDGLVQNIANQLHHLWNDYLFLAENTVDASLKNAAIAIQKIRIYLENLTSEQNIQTLRVRYKNEVYYRLKLARIAPSEANKAELLHRVKSLVKGNLNAIPGLGKRLKIVQQQVEEMGMAKFIAVWDRNWDELTTETDKILYALFDSVYKQFDRSVINKLLEILATTDATLTGIRQQAKLIFDYLKLTEAQIDAFKANLDQEIDELVSSVMQGVDPYVEEVRDLWDNATAGCDEVSLDEMKANYGVRFGINTFNSLLKDLKSDNSAIKDQAKRIVQCLERKLKQKIKEGLLEEWKKLTSKPWQEIEKWLIKTFDAYQEDIWNFYSFIKRVEQAKAKIEGYLSLIRKISQVKTAGELKALKNDAGFKEIYNEASVIILYEYGDDLKRLESIGQAEFNELVNKHWEKIVFVADTLQKLIDEYHFWKGIITKLKLAIEDVRFTITGFISDLEDDAQRRAMLRILVTYLLEKYQVNISLPDLRIDPPQYIVYSKHLSFNTSPGFKQQMENLLKKLHLQKLVLCKLGSDKQWDHSFSESSVYILKLGNDMNMPAILREINNSNKKPGLQDGPFNDQRPNTDTDSPLEQLIKDLHLDLLDAKWRGVFIYKPFADIRNDALLRDLIGKSSLQMAFAAIGGTSYGSASNLDVPFNIYARVKENAEKMDIDLGSGDERPDSQLTLVKFDALVKNTRLEKGEVLLQLDFQNVFGKEYEKDKQKIMIRGTIPAQAAGDNTPRDFEFGVTFHPEKVLDELPGFLDTLQLRGIRATRQAGRSVLEIDATLNFKPFEAIVNVQKLALKNFYIILPPSNNGSENPAGKPRGVNFDIGAIEFIIDKPRPIDFAGIELLPKGLGYIKRYEGDLARNFDNNVIWINAQPPMGHSFTYLKLDVQLGKLPSLGGVNAKDLKFEGVVGIKVKNSKPDPGKPFFGLTGLSAKEISIDLFRFISIYINELLIRNATIGKAANKTNVTFMGAKKIDLKILDWSPLGKNSNFSLAFFHNRPQIGSIEAKSSPKTAMIAAYSKKSGADLGIIRLYWILLANNLALDPGILNALLSPSSIANTDPVNDVMDRIFQGIQDSNEGHSFGDISFTSNTSWLFGASFSIADILDRCSFVLHDQYYYGIMLSSTQPWFKQLFGTDALSLAYIPGKTKQLDKFRIEMKLPMLDLMGPMQAGLIALEYGLNRDFLIDFGFPWKDGNHYLWHRTFSFAAGIFETRFGFYFEKRTDITVTGDKLVTIGAGVAFSYGYKVGARSPFAWAEAGISVTVILMGSVTFKFASGGNAITQFKGTLYKVEVIGVIGIYAYATGGINFWVLSAEIRAEVVAALAGHLIYLPSGNSSLTFSATLSVRYFASCRIKLGFVKITVKVAGSLSYGVSGRIGLN